MIFKTYLLSPVSNEVAFRNYFSETGCARVQLSLECILASLERAIIEFNCGDSHEAFVDILSKSIKMVVWKKKHFITSLFLY